MPDHSGQPAAGGVWPSAPPHDAFKHVCDLPRVTEVFPHEPFDAQQAVLRPDAADGCNSHLLVASQIVGRPARGEVQVVPQPQEKFRRVPQAVGVRPRHHAELRELIE